MNKKNPKEHPGHEQSLETPEIEHSSPPAPGAQDGETIDPMAEAEKYRELALRAAADLENYRKRMIREKEEAIRFANTSLLERLLPILDNFELGLEAARSEASAKGIVDGFSMVHRQLGDFLQASGLQLIAAEGQPFDPKFHEALGHEVDPSRPEGVVLRQLRKGYRLADRLVRPASVIVNKVA